MYRQDAVYAEISRQFDSLWTESDIIWRNYRKYPHGIKNRNSGRYYLKGHYVYGDNIVRELKNNDKFKFFAGMVASMNVSSDDDVFEVFKKYKKMSALKRYFIKRRYIKETFATIPTMRKAKKIRYCEALSSAKNGTVLQDLLKDIDGIKSTSGLAVARNQSVIMKLRNDLSALIALGADRRNAEMTNALCAILSSISGGIKKNFTPKEANKLMKKFTKMSVFRRKARNAYLNIPQEYIDKIQRWQENVKAQAKSAPASSEFSSVGGTCRILEISDTMFSGCEWVCASAPLFSNSTAFKIKVSLKDKLRSTFGSEPLNSGELNAVNSYCNVIGEIFAGRCRKDPFVNSDTPKYRGKYITDLFNETKEDYISERIPLEDSPLLVNVASKEEIRNMDLEQIETIAQNRSSRFTLSSRKAPLVLTHEEYRKACETAVAQGIECNKHDTDVFINETLADAKSVFNRHVKRLLAKHCSNPSDYMSWISNIYKNRRMLNDSFLYRYDLEAGVSSAGNTAAQPTNSGNDFGDEYAVIDNAANAAHNGFNAPANNLPRKLTPKFDVAPDVVQAYPADPAFPNPYAPPVIPTGFGGTGYAPVRPTPLPQYSGVGHTPGNAQNEPTRTSGRTSSRVQPSIQVHPKNTNQRSK